MADGDSFNGVFSLNMPPLALDCPLCCNEQFTSKDSLKYHLLETIDNLRCRLCGTGCSDILELVEHLDRNCDKKDLVQVKSEDTSSMGESEDASEMVDEQDVELIKSKDKDAEDSPDNDPNGLYSCLMCNMNFSSIEKHLEKYHEGEEVLLETDEVDEDQIQEVENTGDEFEDNTVEEDFVEEEATNIHVQSPLKRNKELSFYKGNTVKATIEATTVNDDDGDDIDNGESYQPQNPIVEKYLFSKEFASVKRVRKCCVPTCKERWKNGSRHRFPKSQPEMFNIWLNKIRPLGFEQFTLEEIYNRYVVCEAHFESKCFEVSSRRGLKRNATPTLNLPDHNWDPKSHRRCCVPTCKNLGPYHGFPSFRSKPELFKIWLENTKPNNWNNQPWHVLYARYRICRSHFEPADFCLRSGKIRLKPIAIPTKNIPGFKGQKTPSEPVKPRTCDKYIKLIEDAIAGCDKRHSSSTPYRSMTGPSNQQSFKGEVRLLDDNEVHSIKDKSLISEILRCPSCTLKFPNLTHYEKHKCAKKNVSNLLNRSKPKKTSIINQPVEEVIKQGKFKCTFCQIRYRSLKALKEHMKTHLVEDDSGNIVTNTVTLSLHVCEICNTKFPTLKSLRLHAKMHKPIPAKEVEPPVDYNIMGETEVTEEGDILTVKHEMFQCPECFKEFDMKYKEAHLSSHNDESEYDCIICNKKFHSQSNLEMHIKAHSDVKKFSCSYCKKPFNSYEAMQDHAKDDCLKKQYECQYCGRRFSKPHEKVKHERIHTGEKPHVCQVCGKSFRVSFCLTLHMRTHTGSRPYMCNQCGKRFKSNGVYVHHLKTHSEVRNYKCPYCAKAFKTSVQLSSHKNSHTKPFSCTECNRPFASLYAVRAHMATHKKENNLKYDCWLCGATYARSFALKDHMNSVHMDYSITGETQNGEAVTLHGEQEEVEYEQVEDDEKMHVQDEENEETQIATADIANVDMVEP